MKADLEKIGIIASYFSENIPNLYVTKLLKLFYYLDFVSYKTRGAAVTNDMYFKLPYGPVPTTIKNEIDMLYTENILGPNFKSQLSSSIELKSDKEKNGKIVLNKAKTINLRKLANSELELMKCIVSTFKNTTAKEISNKTHKESPWLSTSDYSMINYELANDLDIAKILPTYLGK